MTVVLKPHDPAWFTEFTRIKQTLQTILASNSTQFISIEHVGSTSIPGLLAKPVLDIAIIVSTPNVASASAALVAAGYTVLGELGVPNRWAFRQPGYAASDQAGEKEEEGEMRRNTYVVLEGCMSLRNYLDLKRLLLEDEGARMEYGEVKRRLVESVDGVDEYCEGKTEVVLGILRKAGWSEVELEELRVLNTLK